MRPRDSQRQKVYKAEVVLIGKVRELTREVMVLREQLIHAVDLLSTLDHEGYFHGDYLEVQRFLAAVRLLYDDKAAK